MRTVSIVLLAFLLAGCSRDHRPVAFTGPAPAPASAALDCARTQLQNRGYNVVTSDQVAGSVTGVRVNERNWLLKLIGFTDTANQITATATSGQLQVTALSSEPGDPAQGGPSLVGEGANRQAEEDARVIFNACASA
jgi:PBP1b-binding outer membrane lipoprotein LpoB